MNTKESMKEVGGRGSDDAEESGGAVVNQVKAPLFFHLIIFFLLNYFEKC